MALNIKNREVERLASEVADLAAKRRLGPRLTCPQEDAIPGRGRDGVCADIPNPDKPEPNRSARNHIS